MSSPVAPRRVGLLIGFLVVLAGCGQAQQPTASAPPASVSASAEASPSPTATAQPTATAPPTATQTETPAESLPPFACETLEIEAGGEVAQAVITDVRIGRHADYDRIVFEFGRGRAGGSAGVPAYSLTYVGPPLTKMPSDLPMEVPGSTFMELVLQGGTKLDDDLTLVYDGPTRFDPDWPTLVALYERGDFEAVSAWYLGLDREPCIRVFTLTDPPRLVIDLEH